MTDQEKARVLRKNSLHRFIHRAVLVLLFVPLFSAIAGQWACEHVILWCGQAHEAVRAKFPITRLFAD